MGNGSEIKLANDIRDAARKLEDSDDLDPLLELVGDARYVLLGEASHGTSEYYTWRAQLSRRLIQEKKFSFIAVEGDWPDCYQLNRYVKGYTDAGENALEVLRSFHRWPTWMWANWEVAAMAEWLRRYNLTQATKIGFYGLDVYSLWESMRAIIEYLQEVDSEAVDAAKKAYLCFEPFGEDVQAYAYATAFVPQTCEDEVVDLLTRIRQDIRRFPEDSEDAFSTEQNARIAVNAERYYRTMVRGGGASWNIRDHHMVDTLEHLMDHHGDKAKAIIWAHNTHIGDARATDMAEANMVNIGQLTREHHSDDGVRLIGFSSYQGSVIAGQQWGAERERMPVPQARSGSWEDVLHRAGAGNKILVLGELTQSPELLQKRGHRAIGVVYHPERERFGNYVPTVLPRRYDALLYLDETEALHPLHIPGQEQGKLPDLYPWGI